MTDGKTACSELGLRERVRLAHILDRLGSPFENERAIAALLASALLAKHGLTWSDLTTGLHAASDPPPAPDMGTLPKRQWRRSGSRLWSGYCRRQAAPLQRGFDIQA